MVKKSHTACWWPGAYEPIRNFGQRGADWYAPQSETAVLTDSYVIIVELPGAKAEDVNVSLHDNSLVLSGEKKFERQEKGHAFFFSEREAATMPRTAGKVQL